MSRIFVEMTEEEYQEYCEFKQENESSDKPKEKPDSTRDCVEKLSNMMIATNEESYSDPTTGITIKVSRYRAALNNMDVELVTKEYLL